MKHRKLIISISLSVIICVAIIFSVKVFAGAGFHEVKIKLSNNYSNYILGTGNLDKNAAKTLIKYTSNKSTAYLNKDGTITLDIFDCPIRFINSNKRLQYIDDRLSNVSDHDMKKSGYIYTIAASDIQPYYPYELNKGIILKGAYSYSFGVNKNVKAQAQCVSKANIIKQNMNMVEYDDTFGDRSKLYCYPTSLGSNTETEFTSSPTSNELSFWLNAKNCNVQVENGGYITMTTNSIVNAGLGYTTNQIIGVIQAPLLKDSKGNISCLNKMVLKKVGDGEYVITATLDKSFLSSKNTKYPVKSLMSFELFRDKEPDSAIYSNTPSLNSYLSNYSVIGDSPENGLGQNRIRFTFAKDDYLKSDQIEKATYTVYNLSNNNASDNLELCTMLDDWCSLASHWSDGLQFGDKTSEQNTQSGPELKFDITSEVKKWCDAPTELEEHKGVLMKSLNEKEGVYNVILSNDNSLYNNRIEVVLKKQ